MISVRLGLFLTLTLSPIFACSYDYSRFDKASGGSTATDPGANGGTVLSTTEEYGQGGSAGGTLTSATPSLGGTTAITTQPCADIDLQSDHDNCGRCGHVCLDELVCIAGVCSCEIDGQCSSVINKKAFCNSKGLCSCGGTQCLENQVCEFSASKYVCYSPNP